MRLKLVNVCVHTQDSQIQVKDSLKLTILTSQVHQQEVTGYVSLLIIWIRKNNLFRAELRFVISQPKCL